MLKSLSVLEYAVGHLDVKDITVTGSCHTLFMNYDSIIKELYPV